MNKPTKDLEMLESYTEGMMAISENNWKKGIIKFTETAEIFDNFGTSNKLICQTQYYIKQKQLLCFYQIKKYDFCLQILKEIKKLNNALISFVKQKSKLI